VSAPFVRLGRGDETAAPAAGAFDAAAPMAVRVHPDDDVAVAVRPLAAGTEVTVEGARVTPANDERHAYREIAIWRAGVTP
jgi:hypothetical protein